MERTFSFDRSNDLQLREKNSNWTKTEIKLLSQAIEYCGCNWFEVAKQLPNRNPNQCALKWKRLNGNRSRKNNFWTEIEDQKLLALVYSYGKKWCLIAKHMDNRDNKQCRDRYVNILDPTLKFEDFFQDEDDNIYFMYTQLGPKWKLISNNLVGIVVLQIQTRDRYLNFSHISQQNQVKNRFITHIRKHYFKLKNPYYTKLSPEQAKAALDKVRETHMIALANMGFYEVKNNEQATCEENLSEQEFSNRNIIMNQQYVQRIDEEF